MKVKENKVVDIATLQCRLDQLYVCTHLSPFVLLPQAICQSLTADSLAKDEDIGMLHLKCMLMHISTNVTRVWRASLEA